MTAVSTLSSNVLAGQTARLNPLEGAALIAHIISGLPDGRIFAYAQEFELNANCDTMILSNRSERFEMRQVGPASRAWVTVRDEVRDHDAVPSVGRALEQLLKPRIRVSEP